MFEIKVENSLLRPQLFLFSIKHEVQYLTSLLAPEEVFRIKYHFICEYVIGK